MTDNSTGNSLRVLALREIDTLTTVRVYQDCFTIGGTIADCWCSCSAVSPVSIFKSSSWCSPGLSPNCLRRKTGAVLRKPAPLPNYSPQQTFPGEELLLSLLRYTALCSGNMLKSHTTEPLDSTSQVRSIHIPHPNPDSLTP